RVTHARLSYSHVSADTVVSEGTQQAYTGKHRSHLPLARAPWGEQRAISRRFAPKRLGAAAECPAEAARDREIHILDGDPAFRDLLADVTKLGIRHVHLGTDRK